MERLCTQWGLAFRSLEPAVLESVSGAAVEWNRRSAHAEAAAVQWEGGRGLEGPKP